MKAYDFIHRLFELTNQLEMSGQCIFSPVGLTGKTFQTLFYISQGIHTSKQLSQSSYGSKANMAKKLKFLEENEFITREIDTHDKRVFRFFITQKGSHTLQTVTPIYEQEVEKIFHNISHTQLKGAHLMLEKIIKNLITSSCEK